ncbi:putative pentatricopeptide repeat-containing protein At5g47460 [Lactuca sativa]|uniref:putative pentatricopeptide repeat-containing protein At5g47460 n=1 Tax=Lactuca sativa TaxID=4236 RepID=UPI000CD91F77|nr:putative pentatricopeptide repeat-containing protein At5g47460 [Lactuca sativa]
MKVFANITKTNIPNYKHTHTQHQFLQNHFITSNQVSQRDAFKSCFKDISDLHENDINNKMPNNGDKPNGYDLVYKIRECTNLGLYNSGQQLHSHVLRYGFNSDVFVSSALINFYVKLDLVEDAHKLFDEIPEPGLVAWNSLITGYVRSGKSSIGLHLFLQLQKSTISSDSYSFTAILPACGQLHLVQLGKSIHSKVIKFGIQQNTFIANCLIDMYGKCNHVEDAINIFDETCFKDTFSWNSVIASCARNQRIEQAFHFLHQMPNPDTISYNEIINGIAQFGNIEHAIEILSTIPNPNSSSWNSILTSYVNRNRPRNAIEFFSNMHSNNIKMDEFTFSSILSGVARLGAFTWGILIHCCVVKHGLDESVVIGSSLIDMYAKCGFVNTAEFLFELLPDKNLVTWNAMISGYAHNEKSTKVFEFFEILKDVKDLKPDGITFLNVLSACWHAKASLKVANRYFESMIYDYKIDPTVEHCSCLIKVMGCEGEIWRAEGVIKRLGFESSGEVWRAVLAACGGHGDLEVAEMAARKVIDLGGDMEFVYVMMSNIYAQFGKWEDARVVRKVMRDNNVIKEAGFSWIDI